MGNKFTDIVPTQIGKADLNPIYEVFIFNLGKVVYKKYWKHYWKNVCRPESLVLFTTIFTQVAQAVPLYYHWKIMFVDALKDNYFSLFLKENSVGYRFCANNCMDMAI